MINTSQITLKSPGTATADGFGDTLWQTPSNVLTDNATDTWWGAFGGGQSSDTLYVRNFGFAIPDQAIIDGVLVTVDGSSFSAYTDQFTLVSNAVTGENKGGFNALQQSYGGSTDLWTLALTPALVNHTDFGVKISGGDISGGDGSMTIDYISITVYWHFDVTVAPAEVETRFDYKIYAPSGEYLGVLPDVVSEFQVPQDINTAGSPLNIEVAASMDDSQPVFAPGNLLQWLPGDWDYRTRISVQRSKVTATLTDFPMLVDLSHMHSHFWTNVKSDGSDLRFTDAYGTVELPYELINFNKTNKTGHVWFKAKLTTEYDSQFFIYYGNAGAAAYAATDPLGSRNVWDANFKAVYHLDEAANTTASGYKDATANQVHGTGVSMSQAAIAGKIHQAAEFDGTDDYITIGSVHGLTNVNATLSCWVYVSSQSQNGTFVKVGTGANGYAIGQGGTTFENDGGNLIMIYDGVRWIVTSHFLAIGWNLVHMTINGSGVPSAWVNGALNAAYSGTNAINPTTSSGIANSAAVANRYYSDAIDEVRYSNVARSAAWIAAEYANQSNPSTFYTIGSYQTQDAEGYTAKVRNGNLVAVYETSYYYPNGKLMYQGQMNKVEASFKPDIDGVIKIMCHSEGRDLDNMVARGSPFSYTNEVVQTSQNNRTSVIFYDFGGWETVGQTFRTDSDQTNIGRLQLMLDGAATVTIRVYTNPTQNTLLGSVTKAVNVVGPTVVNFDFSDFITTTPSTDYFFSVWLSNNQSIWLHYSSANPYANGARYDSSYGGGSGGGSFVINSGHDLYFVAASGTPTTSATYTSKDPTTQMLKPIIDDYNNRGGVIKYNDLLGTVDATGLSLTISFITNTVLEAINKVLDMSPAGFYYYVDLGTNLLWFKETSRTADFVFVKGRHVEELDLVFSIENVINEILFSGGPTAGVNLYAQYSDSASKAMYGTRLDRKSDNRVTVQATADAIGNSNIAEKKNELSHTGITIQSRTMDITLLKPGKTIGFRGYNNFIDNMLLQIVKVDYSARRAVLQVGTMPMRFNTHIEQTLRGLIAEQTLANPSTPA